MSDPMNQPKAPSDAAITKFQEAELRIRNPTIAIKLWGEFFSEEEQKHSAAISKPPMPMVWSRCGRSCMVALMSVL